MHWGWLRGTGPSLARHIPEVHYKMLRDKKGRQSISSQDALREKSPPHLSPQKEKPRAWARTATDSLPPLFVSDSLHFSVMLKLFCPTDNSVFSVLFLTCLPTVWLYCTVYSPLTHFQHWLGIIILNPVVPPLSWALKLVTVWLSQLSTHHLPSSSANHRGQLKLKARWNSSERKRYQQESWVRAGQLSDGRCVWTK